METRFHTSCKWIFSYWIKCTPACRRITYTDVKWRVHTWTTKRNRRCTWPWSWPEIHRVRSTNLWPSKWISKAAVCRRRCHCHLVFGMMEKCQWVGAMRSHLAFVDFVQARNNSSLGIIGKFVTLTRTRRQQLVSVQTKISLSSGIESSIRQPGKQTAGHAENYSSLQFRGWTQSMTSTEKVAGAQLMATDSWFMTLGNVDRQRKTYLSSLRFFWIH